jgi:hypothetical protein
MTTEELRYPQCRCAQFGQSRFEPVRRTALDGKLWWCIIDHVTGKYDYSKFKTYRQALVHLAIELRHNRLPYDPDPGFGKKWIHERTAQEVALLVCGMKLKEDKDETK